MIVKLKSVAVSETSSFGKRNTTGSFSTLPVTVLNRHNPIRKVALLHIKIEAVHGDKLDESDVICLFFSVSQMVAEHEATSLASMGMKVNVHL